MQKKYNFIFFDNDGILVDTEKLYFEANRRTLAEYAGIELSLQTYKEVNLLHGQSVLALDGAEQELRTKRDKLFSELITKNKDQLILPGVQEVIDHCRKLEIRMAIVTSSKKEHFNLIHSYTNLLDNFEFTVLREDYVNSKPSPDPYLLALEKSAMDSNECFVIEDTPRGVKSALAAGIDAAAVPNVMVKEFNFLGVPVFEKLQDLIGIIRKPLK